MDFYDNKGPIHYENIAIENVYAPRNLEGRAATLVGSESNFASWRIIPWISPIHDLDEI